MVSKKRPIELWWHDVREFDGLVGFANEELGLVPSYGSRRPPKPRESIEKGLTAWQYDADRVQRVVGRKPETGILIFPPMRPSASEQQTSAARRELRELLGAIASSKRFNRYVCRKIDDELKSIQWDIRMRSSVWRLQATVESLSQWFCFTLSRLQIVGLDDALGLCEMKKCGRFFIRWPNQPGKVGGFCSKQHSDIWKNRKSRRKKKRHNANRGITT